MKQCYDIPINITMLAESEVEAEELVNSFMRTARICISEPDFVDWEAFQFVETDLKQSCCC